MIQKLIVKAALAALLFGCLAQVPYDYFQFVRIGGFIGFLYLAYLEFQEERPLTGLASAACAILLNPLYKITFKRDLWNTIDVIIAGLLLLWIIVDIIMNRKLKY